MPLTYILHFAFGLIASFLGSIPFGTVNVSVIDTTVRKSFKAGLQIAIAAGIVEMVQSFIAVHCSMFITKYVQDSIYVKIFIIILLLGIGLFFFLRKGISDTKSETNKKFKVSDFAKGAILGLINPQALPFYVFVITWLEGQSLIEVHHEAFNILFFLLGTSAGRFLALLLYGYFSSRLSQKLLAVSNTMNKVLGSLFMILALVQVVQLF